MKKLIFFLALIFSITVFAQVDSVGNDPVISTDNPYLAILITFVGTWLITVIGGLNTGIKAWWDKNKWTFYGAVGVTLTTLITMAVADIQSSNVIIVMLISFVATWLISLIAGVSTGSAFMVWWEKQKAEFWYQLSILGTAIVTIIFGIMPS